MSRFQPSHLFLLLSGSNSFLRTTMYIVLSVYYVSVVHMNALELVLCGTALELSYFVWQTPTGVAADVFGRRGAIIAGWAITGGCFLVEGLVPTVGAILAAQTVLGLSEACIDGSTEAWLADEVGQEGFGLVLLRASQVGQIMSIGGIAAAVVLGSIHLALPIVVGGIGMIAMSGFFALAMPEEGFRPGIHDHTSPLQALTGTMQSGIRVARGNSVLLTILGVELFFGAGSEGFDRLWTAHIIRDIRLPGIASLGLVAWFALIGVAQSLVVLGANRLLRPRLDRVTASGQSMGSLLAVLNLLYVAAVVGFALNGSFAAAVAFLLLKAAIGAWSTTIGAVWYNRNIGDSSVRATVLSLTGQANALGQWVGGPLVGALGTISSLPAALTATGLVGAPASLLYGLASRRPAEAPVAAPSSPDASGQSM